MNKLFVIDDGFSVFAASDINDILSRMCSNLTCKLIENDKGCKPREEKKGREDKKTFFLPNVHAPFC